MLGWENVELFVRDIARKYHTVTSSVQHFYAACFKCQSNEWLGVSSNHCHIREIFPVQWELWIPWCQLLEKDYTFLIVTWCSVVLCHPQTESEFKEHKFKITTLCFFLAWQLWSAKVPWVSGISKFTWGLDLGNPKKLGAKIDLFFYDLI